MINDGSKNIKSSGNFQTMRSKARAGKLAGKSQPVAGDGFHTPKSKPAVAKSTLPEEVASHSGGPAINLPGTGDS